MAHGNALARSRLDARLERFRPLGQEPIPHRGWIRAIRDALGMSGRELAERMRVSQPTITDLERNEVRGTIQLDTLRRAADALDCDLAYVLLPRRSLDEAVSAQARRRARAHLASVAHNSRLEDQSITDSETAVQVEDLADHFIDRRGLWSEPGR
ncbi:MAG: mobile mystery protein A [Chloroflexi bacterium]|nr:mobile mystery protein A [Chloroflexota bacterium]MDA1002957.1 mobile mystery protein A [Chloroflexota bacterium]